MISSKDRKALVDWDEFIENLNRESPLELNESEVDKRKRIARLEANHEAWFKYYFSAFYSAEPAPFHLRSTKRVMSNPEHYEARPWSRELSKSGRTMMEVLKLTLTGKKRNVIMASANKDLAVKLLAPYKALLEKNTRIINDYGLQESFGNWAENHFVTRKGVSFLAIGAGQSPRGTREMEVRPDVLLIDDIDTDETIANPDMVNKTWSWVERALMPASSISNKLLVIVCGNIIAETCCMNYAIEKADAYEIVNIRNKDGKSSWPNKNTEEMIDRRLAKISYESYQGEYFNNPIKKGTVFEALHYKKMLPLNKYKAFVIYGDPSYKSGKKNDYKAAALMAMHGDEIHVLRVYCAQSTTAQMLDFYYDCLALVNGKAPVYCYIEWPWIDDAFKIELQQADIRHGIILPLRADDRKKPDKYSRIESTLEPLNRREKLWFNEDLKDSTQMKTGESQFLCISATSRAHDDFPDAIEGGVVKLNGLHIHNTAKLSLGHRRSNPKRFKHVPRSCRTSYSLAFRDSQFHIRLRRFNSASSH